MFQALTEAAYRELARLCAPASPTCCGRCRPTSHWARGWL